MLELLLAFAVGIIIGIIFGLIPGLHPNLIIVFIPFFTFANPLATAVFIVAMGISNVIIDFIPSIFLGAPEEGTELAVLPGHRMLMFGHGYAAIKMSVIGAVGACIFLAILVPALFISLPMIFRLVASYIHVLLIFVLAVMILSERYKYRVALIASISAAIGIISNRLPLSNEFLLFPILAGMFGVSHLLLQSKNNTVIPKQTLFEPYVDEKSTASSVIKGSFAGIISGFLPGVGSSQMAAFANTKKDAKGVVASDEKYLITLGAITMANLFLSLLSIWLISRHRSGIAVAVSTVLEINLLSSLTIIATIIAATGLTAMIALFIAKNFAGKISSLNYTLLSRVITIFIIILVFIFTQW
ncbi:MAG: tripartite tricarboxylate transporter permease, partial [Candidatus Aenigmarchaeota archaeon]|nr:tripartite tricarboxylate transporter permease [Candidatus Aenigmarchaeota archaeon]